MQLENEIALVTGGGSGIGRAISQHFAAEGATVVVNDLTLDAAKATVDSFVEGAPAGHPVAADVSDSAQVRAMFDEIEAAHGRLDILINNAGIGTAPGDPTPEFMAAVARGEAPPPVITQLSNEALNAMLNVHVGGAVACTREAVKLMLAREQGGAIVNLSSIAALTGMGSVHYSAAKGAILGLTRQLVRDLSPYGIRVNAICPGLIDTPMLAPFPAAMMEPMVAATPIPRLGRPVEIAAAALYLASDESSFTTGQWLSPNGGIFIG